MRTRTTLLLLSLLALTSSGAANHAFCEMTTSQPEVDTGPAPAGRWYVDNDPCPAGCSWSIWVYEESNGADGLQRHDESSDDTCGGEYVGDTIIF